jgi:hypothetical protein
MVGVADKSTVTLRLVLKVKSGLGQAKPYNAERHCEINRACHAPGPRPLLVSSLAPFFREGNMHLPIPSALPSHALWRASSNSDSYAHLAVPRLTQRCQNAMCVMMMEALKSSCPIARDVGVDGQLLVRG